METLSLHLKDEAATLRFGEDLALALGPGLCVALEGDLGAGKSTLARATLRALANDPSLEVPSPTFTLVQVYDLRFQVGHFDLYRIGDSSELDELGFDEILETGVCLVEWPDRAGNRLPEDLLRIELSTEGAGRRATISTRSSRTRWHGSGRCSNGGKLPSRKMTKLFIAASHCHVYATPECARHPFNPSLTGRVSRWGAGDRPFCSRSHLRR